MYVRRRETAPLPGRRRGGRAGSRSAVLELQRMAGNRATTALIARAPESCAYPGYERTVALQPIFFKASENDPAPTGKSWKQRLEVARKIWGKLGVKFVENAPIYVVSECLKAGGEDCAGAPQLQPQGSMGIPVAVIDNDLDHPGIRGGATRSPGTANALVIMSDRGKSTTLLAHELGHVLGLLHPSSGGDEGGSANTIMEPSKSVDTIHSWHNTLWNYEHILWPPPDMDKPVCLRPDGATRAR